jgi:uncharacterized membrane protein YedE/YeeE
MFAYASVLFPVDCLEVFMGRMAVVKGWRLWRRCLVDGRMGWWAATRGKTCFVTVCWLVFSVGGGMMVCLTCDA